MVLDGLFSDTREEELQYVEFIKEVTDDVLNRGVFTDR